MSTTPTAIETVFREEYGLIIATLIRDLGDFSLAEEAIQDALIIALERWPCGRAATQTGRLDPDGCETQGGR